MHQFFPMRPFSRISAIAFLFAIGALAWIFWALLSSAARAPDAQGIVEMCAKEKDASACYEREVPMLYPILPIPEIFGLVRAIRAQDASYQFCHVLSHKLGERVVAQDPSRWLDAIPLNPPDGLCSNGFIHGVVGGKFRAEVLDGATIESLIPDFKRACEARPNWRPSDLDRAICYHGMGHLYDFITDANIPDALALCAKTTSDQFRRVCIEGVFMQIYQPLEPDDFELIKRMPVAPSTSTVRTFCARYTEPQFVGACLRESWPFFAREVRSGTGVEVFCSHQPNAEEEKKCYESATAIIGRMSLGNTDAAAAACHAIPSRWQDVCFLTVARAVLEEDRDDGGRAVHACEAAGGEKADVCLRALASQARFVYGSDTSRRQRFCAVLPEEYHTVCK